MTKELWKSVIGYEGLYEVSNLGRIKSLSKKINFKKFTGHEYSTIQEEQILKNSFDSFGYLQTGLSKDKKQIRHLTHRLVAKAFIPNPENKPQVNHKNGIKNDNRAENLEWCTRSENAKHSFIIGLQCNKGDNHPMAKLTISDVMKIRKLHKEGISSYQISKIFPCAYTTIKDIIKRKTWAHI